MGFKSKCKIKEVFQIQAKPDYHLTMIIRITYFDKLRLIDESYDFENWCQN